MTTRLFLTQAAVERWTASGRAELADGALLVTGGTLDGARLELEPALRVKAVAGEAADPHALVGKARGVAALRERGAEVMGDSMLLEDTAYEVEQGFLAAPDPALLARLVPARAPADVPGVIAREGEAEADVLARFLLDRLT